MQGDPSKAFLSYYFLCQGVNSYGGKTCKCEDPDTNYPGITPNKMKIAEAEILNLITRNDSSSH